MNNWTRKEFLKTTLVGGTAALAASRVYGQAPAVARSGSANGDIRVAVVGINGQGAGHMRNYIPGQKDTLAGARLVAICDVDSAVLGKQLAVCEKAGVKPQTYSDYRKLLENKEIDAIVLGTPNHQHSLQSIWGLQAGKDVYCEKPLSHNVWEGRQVVEASKKYTKNIVLAGTQNRSSEDIMEAIQYVRAGELGAIKWVRGLCYKKRDSIGKTTAPTAVPETVDYNLWSGPAALKPPHRNSKARGPIHYDWHWFWNYGGGDITNQGIHQMDVARWFLGEKGLPPTVMSFGGRFGYDDDAETPNTLVSVLGYQKAPLIFEVRGLPMNAKVQDAMDAYRGSKVGVVVQCEKGFLTVSEGGTVNVFDNENKKIKQFAKSTNGAHRANWIKAVQSRKVIHGLVEECHYSSSLCHLANVSYLVGADKSTAALADSIKADADTKDSLDRVLTHLKAHNIDVENTKMVVGPKLKLDGKTEMFVGSEEFVKAANKNPLLKREGRGEFKIPVMQGSAVARS
ncbi:MAG: Gfo/Idh/MocA family oxidoreductase [Verrucomicrobiota bacterium]